MSTRKKLKIALIAPVWIRVPPALYGGIESVVGLLADGLVDRGHEVTLFATGDAVTKAKLVSVFNQPLPHLIGKVVPDIYHVSSAYQHCAASDFDLIHDHTLSGAALSAGSRSPVLITIHTELNDMMKRYYMKFNHGAYFNAISDNQRRSLSALRYVETVYNAIDFDDFSFNENREDFLVSLSRFGPEKGQHVAIEVAKKTNRRLVLAGKIDPGPNITYFRRQIEPHIDGRQIRFLGEVSGAEKRKLLAQAACFIFPIRWAEPFGLVMLEAMAGGTPVVAFDRGSVREVIEPGVSGFVARDLDEMVELVGAAEQLDRLKCREYAEQTFSVSRMVDGYIENYRHILRSEGKIARSITIA